MGGLLNGHLAVVTGGGSGIGRAITKGYAEAGAKVIAVDINLDNAAETARMVTEAGGEAWSFKLDVTDTKACRDLAQQVESKIGAISVLVNCAGVVRRNHVTSDTIEEDWHFIVDVNLTGVFNVTHAFMDQLRVNQGRIINIGSIQSFVHTPNSVAYTASKGGVLNFTKALASELGPDGVRVNAIGPGLIETPLNEDMRTGKPEIVEDFKRRLAIKRLGQPEDIVGPAVFLASDMAAYVTGIIIVADGGFLTR